MVSLFLTTALSICMINDHSGIVGYYEDGLVEFEMLETGKVKVTKIKDSTLSNYKIGGCFSDVKFLHDRQEILAYDASRQLLFLVKSDSEISIITDDIIYNAPSNRQIRIHNDLVFVITRFNAIVVYKAFLREPFRIICEIQGIPGKEIIDFHVFNNNSLVALSSDGFLSYYSYDNKRGDLVTVKRMLLEESESMNALALNSQHNIICAISTQRDDILPQSTNIMVYLFKYDHEDNYFAKTKEKMFRVDLHLSLKPEDIDIDLGQTLNNEVVLFLLLKKKPSTGLGMILSEDTIKQYCQMRLQNRAQAFVFEGSDMWILDKRGTINKFN